MRKSPSRGASPIRLSTRGFHLQKINPQVINPLRVLGARIAPVILSRDMNQHRMAHALNRSLNRFFFSFSVGLLATPSNHDITFATVTVCSSSGASIRIVSRVPGGSGASRRTLFLNPAIASTAASNRLSAGRNQFALGVKNLPSAEENAG